ncbi:hypothetical protein K437DRAFT_10251 [Tilletiaria anomala UBC 951]|uniref:Uncharacterized protein n=1 Tax=Tilletiaria anomala (strain ATCC 24038 / CBS 436.72 / UBC 951) TaxID=1037660 RepID=A0A066VDH6_TILAU|nr:uncharacterized protein K437DRAFT_10251 [Tilletiaria anomala UBC 951]KDN39521.1 hypothetical protein K437DRAFT_10251 [Tilletiaria anomala UBC 951]
MSRMQWKKCIGTTLMPIERAMAVRESTQATNEIAGKLMRTVVYQSCSKQLESQFSRKNVNASPMTEASLSRGMCDRGIAASRSKKVSLESVQATMRWVGQSAAHKVVSNWERKMGDLQEHIFRPVASPATFRPPHPRIHMRTHPRRLRLGSQDNEFRRVKRSFELTDFTKALDNVYQVANDSRRTKEDAARASDDTAFTVGDNPERDLVDCWGYGG